MGIQLDWQIEAEQTRQQAQEDAISKQARRRARRRIIFFSLVLALLLCGTLGGLLWRLNTVEERIEDDLRAAVEAEFAALRIGNQAAFMQMQRSASDQWLNSQRTVFAEYQGLKQAGRLGNRFVIQEVTVDQERGRVVVREEIDGVAYQQVWFYWRYEPQAEDDTRAGWRHVPADVTFWGEQHTLEKDHIKITYYDLDEALAKALADKLEAWWSEGCKLLNCTSTPPQLELIIDPQAGIRQAWEPSEGWRLRLLSPYLNARVPAQPLSAAAEQEIAMLIGMRLIRHASAERLQFPDQEVLSFDTDWLKYQLLEWLTGRFLGRPSPFMDSLSAVFGADAPGKIALGITDNQQLLMLGQSLDPTVLQFVDFGVDRLGQIDWRSFFAWRLQLEHQRLASGDIEGYYSLYENQQANNSALGRAANPVYATTPAETVQGVAFSFRNDGGLVALVETLDVGGLVTQVQFAWNGQTFVRAN